MEYPRGNHEIMQWELTTHQDFVKLCVINLATKQLGTRFPSVRDLFSN